MHSWSKKGARGKPKEQHCSQVRTGGSDKDRFAVYLCVAKDGTKLPPCFAFKEATFNGTRKTCSNAVSHELNHHLSDSHGNECPP